MIDHQKLEIMNFTQKTKKFDLRLVENIKGKTKVNYRRFRL